MLSFFSLIHGVGEVDIRDKDEKDSRDIRPDGEQPLVPEVESLPYLLLDVRDEDAYKQCHIIGGEFYHISICRQQGNNRSCPMRVLFQERGPKVCDIFYGLV